MRKLLGIFVILFILLIGESFYVGKIYVDKKKLVPTNKPTSTPIPIKISKSIFVPYWNIDPKADFTSYDRLLYFGISVNNKGINENEDGYKNLNKFVDLKKSNGQINTILVVRMVDSNINQNILKDENKQDSLIKESLETAKENKFSGIALDLEISTLFNEDITKQIGVFVQKYYTSAKKYYIPFSIIMYGDNFYRKRPFDMNIIKNNSDEIFIMAYDFHKSIGEPGPNFPLNRGAHYDYDFKQMVTDFTNFIQKEKINIIFGMYGYEWIVDEKRRPIKPAKALTLNEIRKNFLIKCEWEDCIVKRDPYSFETEINYIDSKIIDTYAAMNMHIIWFEDEESVRAKTEFLKSENIGKVSYWVAGYF
ncbi:MAG: glycosyl hydrolase family 18 protein [bacterium]|nr:glycosyl hydrolase family 18 protein [bacterium]